MAGRCDVWRALAVISLVGFLPASYGDQLSHYDTIVVGAGAAGCTAAADLSAAGRRVLMVEAQDRIGGRIWTRQFGDGVVELGAEWIHGTENSVIYDTAKSHNVTIAEDNGEYVLFLADGRRAPALYTDIVKLGYEAYLDHEQQASGIGDVVVAKVTDYVRANHLPIDDATLRQLLRVTEQEVLANEGAAHWWVVGARSQGQDLGGHPFASWHRLGYRTFFDIVLNKHNNGSGLPTLEIKLNTTVTSIEWPQTPDKPVVVNCGDTKYTADNVIVTISLGVLKERYSSLFAPPLPEEKVEAIETIAMGTIGKIILSFERSWMERNLWRSVLWSEAEIAALPESQRWVSRLTVSAPLGSSNTFTLWTSGNTTKYLETLPMDEVEASAVAFLQRVFGANTTIPPVTGIIRTTWFSNPFARGTYSYDSVAAGAAPRARDRLAQPLTDSWGGARVLFAGEATHTEHFGTAHGAAETGRRAAARLLAHTARAAPTGATTETNKISKLGL